MKNTGLESVQAIHDVVQGIENEVRFTHFVQVGNDYERKKEIEILRVEAAERLKEMKDKMYLIKQHLNDSHRYLKNEEMHLRSLILLAKESSIIKLYNLIRVDLENGAMKYFMQFKLKNKVLTFEVIEQTSIEEIRAINQRRMVV
ncbi:MAG: hypothetical protein AWU54_1630 [Candidatus Frackibacter sp. T328-2]|nr:MAG: hypothetical protein AWU54_1630 [Candidatus Frackibacter sp. T328-2]